MTRRRLAAAAIATLATTATGLARADTAPSALTPDGPLTVSSVWRGPVTEELLPPSDLTAVRITVGPGGRGGPIRLRISSTLDRPKGVELGPWTQLPATPGNYTFPVPAPLQWDYRQGVIAVDQQVGDHAIVVAQPCTPGVGPLADSRGSRSCAW